MASNVVRRPGRGNSGYLPSLDGWRAIAVVGVMLTHDRAWVLFDHSLLRFQGYGGFGVYVFFAISGFLITSRILEEEKLCGYFDIRRFYIRRLFRIQPAAWAFLAFVAVLMAVGCARQYGVLETGSSWLAALLLYTNYLYETWKPPTLTGHFWTLAVEEHFYILLSLVLFFIRRRRVAALGILFLLFTLAPQIVRFHAEVRPRSTQWQLTSLLLSALAAVLVRKIWAQRVVLGVLHPWTAFLATPVLMVLHRNFAQLVRTGQLAGYSHLTNELGFAATYLPVLWILATVFHPESLTTRLLETGVFRFVGRISYSLYLWHVVVNYLWNFLGSSGPGPIRHIQNAVLRVLAERPARYCVSFLVAYLSYRLIERPLIRVGHKLAPAATPGRPELADLPLESPAPGFISDGGK